MPGIAALELLADDAVRSAAHAGAAVAVRLEPSTPSAASSGDQLPRKRVLLEMLADDGNHALVDEAPDGFLHQNLVLAELAAHIVEIDGVSHR